jgi:hypothetical protein
LTPTAPVFPATSIFAGIDVWGANSPVVNDIVAGKYAIVFGSWWIPNWPLNMNKNNDPAADWVVGPPLTENGGQPVITINRYAVNIWSVIVMMNFMRGIPHSLEEAASCDGAGHWRILFQVILPVSLPGIASLTLFAMIGHWNSWFDGIFYMNNVNKYPLATYLATQILSNNRNMTNMTPELLALLNRLSDKTVRSAELFISIIPILVVYPFLQRYFVKGIVAGSVKE